jgi:hypothetical protein
VIGGVDVVFDQDRNAVKRTVQASCDTLGIERGGDRKRIGIQLDHRMQRWAVPIQRLNAGDVGADDLPSCSTARLLILNERADRRLFEIEGTRGLLEGMDIDSQR